MNTIKKIGLILCALFFVNSNCMNIQPNISIPTTFTLETIVRTALDKITIDGISQTATYMAGIGLLFLAARDWARAASPFPHDISPFPSADDRSTAEKCRMKSALRYFIGGCAFATAGLIQTYKTDIMNGINTFVTQKLFAGKN